MADISKERLIELLKNKPAGVSEDILIKQLVERGHNIEGLELPSQKKKLEQQKTNEQLKQAKQEERSQDTQELFQGVRDVVDRGVNTTADIKRDVQSGETPLLRGLFQRFGAGVNTTLGVGFETVKGLAKQFTSGETEDKVKNFFTQYGQELSNYNKRFLDKLRNSENPTDRQAAEFIDQTTTLYKENPDFKRTVDSAGGIVEAMTLVSPTRSVASAVSDSFKVGSRLTDDLFKQTLKADARTATEAATADTIVTAAKAASPEQYQEAVTKLASTYKDTLVNNKTTRTFLEKTARENGQSLDELLYDFVDSRGISIDVTDSGRISFDKTIRDFETRQNALGESIGRYLSTRVELTTLDNLKTATKNEFKARGKATEFATTNKKIDNIFNELEARYGETITPTELNELRIEVNQKFKEQDFEVDAFEAIGNASRNRIDEIVGDDSIRAANAEWGKLANQIKIANKLDGQKVDVGLLLDSFGSYLGAATVGAAGVVTGSGSLVIAGLASTFGQKTFANWIRRKKLNSPEVQKVAEELRKDEALVKELIESADQADKETIERLLLPAPENVIEAPLPNQSKSGTIPPEQSDFLRELNAATSRVEKQQLLQKQAQRYKTRESFIKAVNNNPAWLAKFDEAGTTLESIADIIFPQANRNP